MLNSMAQPSVHEYGNGSGNKKGEDVDQSQVAEAYRVRNFSGKWTQELMTLRLQSHGDEIRFYYTGMGQAFLPDRLNPEWRTTFLQDNVFLEDLLSDALINRRE